MLAQMTSAKSHPGNIAAVRKLAAQCAAAEADLLALPEASGMMNRDKADATSKARSEDADPYIAACREFAERNGIWMHIGSTPILSAGKLFNHCVLIDSSGALRARYDKIHLFDVFLDGRPASLESDRYSGGQDLVAVDTPWGLWGLTICYDLRFPQVYRDLAKLGATVVFAPSAFTVPTGKAHWEALARARAIENGCWIVAAAQVGNHEDGRTTYGHSLIVAPWGDVAADLGGHSVGHVVTELDLSLVESARRQIPSLANERLYDLVRAPSEGPTESAMQIEREAYQ